MIERGERQSRDMNYTSFAHCFVLAIGREGFRVYQAWGEHGYRLDEYLKRGGSQLRSWQEATAFLKNFGKLCHYSVSLMLFNNLNSAINLPRDYGRVN
ncbi:hypothetical protein ASPBRDRAFT_532719 [Aspergillus brasiliensis CBS 101740]|uniref:Uncharacterized protein n=1 Tax=Aspergillus brasiliensis (strain CBS 101740 / IMI 381727 / IBT 21946) TaxID=767769 RepID=A0A1L9U1J1_ASPBC|nr:hypothetical protein ASPBRDRAFT_532719 [Aspergillus brasiliensis CBS 101740]